ncbi:MAG: nitrate ABC transporter ATP-binding protein [Georgfuchsia sp.]
MNAPLRQAALPMTSDALANSIAEMSAPKTPVLELRGVGKGYGSGAARSEVLHDVNLSIADGEFVAIVGFSGSGKTTLVSLLAGLIEADGGEILKAGKPLKGPGPDRAVVFQSYSLMPWLSVGENIALAVDAVHASLSRATRKASTAKYVEMVGLGHAIDKKPSELSGGMRQRVAVARALAANPDVLLLDEPLSALDALTRAKLQDEIIRIWNEDQKTVLLITNDVDEALMMADRIIPMNPGPRATLGPSFAVDIPRPRDRRAMNHDATFKRLRRDITQYLIDAGKQRAVAGGAKVIMLPTLTPQAAAAAPNLAQLMGMRHGGQLAQMEREDVASAVKKPHDDRFVEFTQLGKIYGSGKKALKVVDDFNLKIAKGEFVSIIGHSGCGKSTVLSMIAGLIDVSEGGIILDGREISQAGPDRGIVFQSPSLVPWLTAYDNVALGVDRVFPHASEAERRDIVEYHLGRVGLADALHKKARDMSNGMRQRVGIARAFALAPKLLLLDEPFGMLDSLTRWDLQEVLMEVWSRSQVTAIMVTHDVDEAILLADRVVMMTNGPNARVGRVLDVPLERPRTRRALLEHERYYELREGLITFLEECDHA